MSSRILIEWRMIITLFVHIITCMQCTHHLLNFCIHIISISEYVNVNVNGVNLCVCLRVTCERMNVFLPEGTLAHILYFVHSVSRVMWICLCFVLLAACAHLLFFSKKNTLYTVSLLSICSLFIYLFISAVFSLSLQLLLLLLLTVAVLFGFICKAWLTLDLLNVYDRVNYSWS